MELAQLSLYFKSSQRNRKIISKLGLALYKRVVERFFRFDQIHDLSILHVYILGTKITHFAEKKTMKYQNMENSHRTSFILYRTVRPSPYWVNFKRKKTLKYDKPQFFLHVYLYTYSLYNFYNSCNHFKHR